MMKSRARYACQNESTHLMCGYDRMSISQYSDRAISNP